MHTFSTYKTGERDKIVVSLKYTLNTRTTVSLVIVQADILTIARNYIELITYCLVCMSFLSRASRCKQDIPHKEGGCNQPLQPGLYTSIQGRNEHWQQILSGNDIRRVKPIQGLLYLNINAINNRWKTGLF